MGSEIQLIGDGDGIAVIGDPREVELFLAAEGVQSREFSLQRLTRVIGTAAEVAQTGSGALAESGRWVRLTKESARLADKYPLVQKTGSVYSTGAVRGEGGRFIANLEFTRHASVLTNPAVLAGAAGIMAQIAMQQTMDEIIDYLATIDRKVDDILRAQKDAVLADMIGIHLSIEEALTIREHTGRVSEVTWSKVQASPTTIARTQAYALRQLDGLTEKLERTSSVGDLAKAAKDAESTTREWLAVLARCFQLQDAIAILELDRVFDAAPDELERHRLGVRAARRKRLEVISHATERLLERMAATAGVGNAKVLIHPTSARSLVRSSNDVSTSIHDFQVPLGIEGGLDSWVARRWADAAVEAKEKLFATGAQGVDAVRRAGSETVGRAAVNAGRFAGDFAGRIAKRSDDLAKRLTASDEKAGD